MAICIRNSICAYNFVQIKDFLKLSKEIASRFYDMRVWICTHPQYNQPYSHK